MANRTKLTALKSVRWNVTLTYAR